MFKTIFGSRLLRDTVFHPIEMDWKSDKVLSVLFHRSAVTLYLIYILWAFASLILRWPILDPHDGEIISELLSLFILPCAFVSLIGALYFPRLARLEMFSAGSFVTLVFLYEVYVAVDFFGGNFSNGANLILNLSHLVIPIVRIVFIYLTLIKQAEKVESGGITLPPGGKNA